MFTVFAEVGRQRNRKQTAASHRGGTQDLRAFLHSILTRPDSTSLLSSNKIRPVQDGMTIDSRIPCRKMFILEIPCVWTWSEGMDQTNGHWMLTGNRVYSFTRSPAWIFSTLLNSMSVIRVLKPKCLSLSQAGLIDNYYQQNILEEGYFGRHLKGFSKQSKRAEGWGRDSLTVFKKNPQLNHK